MSNKLSNLTEITSLSGNDLFLVAQNNGNSTYTSKKIQYSNISLTSHITTERQLPPTSLIKHSYCRYCEIDSPVVVHYIISKTRRKKRVHTIFLKLPHFLK